MVPPDNTPSTTVATLTTVASILKYSAMPPHIPNNTEFVRERYNFFIFMEPLSGFEPETPSLPWKCSTPELQRHHTLCCPSFLAATLGCAYYLIDSQHQYCQGDYALSHVLTEFLQNDVDHNYSYMWCRV